MLTTHHADCDCDPDEGASAVGVMALCEHAVSFPSVVPSCDDDGNEVPQGESGTIFFEGGGVFEYHNDPEKTKQNFRIGTSLTTVLNSLDKTTLQRIPRTGLNLLPPFIGRHRTEHLRRDLAPKLVQVSTSKPITI